MVTFFFLPIPFILVMIKEPISWVFGFLAVTSLFDHYIWNAFIVPLTLLVGFVGMVIGYHLKHEKSVTQMFISSTLTTITYLLLFYSVTIFVAGVNIIEESMTMFEQSTNTSMDIMNSLGQPVPENFEQTMRDSMEMIQTLMPSAFVVTSMVLSYLFILAAQPFVKRFSGKIVKWPLFRNLRLPKFFYGII